MCNLTFLYAKDGVEKYKKEFLALMARNSVANMDGMGIVVGKKEPIYFKDWHPGYSTILYREFEMDFSAAKWVQGHVRLTSSGTKTAPKTEKEIEKRMGQTHPFILPGMTFMHNGTLHFNTGINPPHDSKYMAEKTLAGMQTGKTLVDSMNQFLKEEVEWGGYCCLISKQEKKRWVPYIIRGYARNLFYYQDEEICLVNTDPVNLDIFLYGLGKPCASQLLPHGYYGFNEKEMKLEKIGEAEKIQETSPTTYVYGVPGATPNANFLPKSGSRSLAYHSEDKLVSNSEMEDVIKKLETLPPTEFFNLLVYLSQLDLKVLVGFFSDAKSLVKEIDEYFELLKEEKK